MNSGWMIGWWTETPFHPGAGTAVGVIDLPVQRERHTGLPTMQASGVKGSLRRATEARDEYKNHVNKLFGTADSTERASGSLGFSDLRVLAYPIRSMTGGTLWVTCPMVLSRFQQECGLVGASTKVENLFPEANQALVTDEWAKQISGKQLFLEEYEYEVKTNTPLSNLAKHIAETLLPTGQAYAYVRQKFVSHLVVIADEEYQYLLSHSTEIHPRIQLSDQKTSKNLWYEETIPRDTLFYSLIFHLQRNRQDEDTTSNEWVNSLDETLAQFGGDESLGRGWFRARVMRGEGEAE
ncbi:MAG TPA: type III-B CRISPR module RAMP protein Cmr4 [Bacilli bacterium]|nr:type III-B CRISPR module RAMP protein Cmr4 [Bacilli bacterium]